MTAAIPDPPTRPEPFECCNRGCCPCIFDYYDDALDRWKAMVAARGLDPEIVLAERRTRNDPAP